MQGLGLLVILFFFGLAGGIVGRIKGSSFFIWFLIVWAIFGGAIARIAAVHVARDEKISVRQAITFSFSKLLSFVFAPVIPMMIILVAGLAVPSAVSTLDPARFSERVRPAPWQERLEQMLIVLDERERTARRIELKKALDQTDPHADPEAYRAIQLEYRRTLTSSRPRKT